MVQAVQNSSDAQARPLTSSCPCSLLYSSPRASSLETSILAALSPAFALKIDPSSTGPRLCARTYLLCAPPWWLAPRFKNVGVPSVGKTWKPKKSRRNARGAPCRTAVVLLWVTCVPVVSNNRGYCPGSATSRVQARAHITPGGCLSAMLCCGKNQTKGPTGKGSLFLHGNA